MKIAIIGYMGTGKSAAGLKIAEKMELEFADLDEIMIYKLGMPISQAYITFGEKVFRSMEESALYEVLWRDDLVIVMGGGLPLNTQNMQLLKDFVKVYFIADAETVQSRLTAMNRPKIWDSSADAARQAFKQRDADYKSYADITVDTSGKTLDEVADETIGLLKNV